MDTFFGISPNWLGTHSLWFALAYLCGSVPYGILIAKAVGLGNLREIGSGNIGATNVLRTGNKAAALATLVLDALKGTLPVITALHLSGENAGIAAAFGAFTGHILPIWLNFRGGKGVATYAGVLLGFGWQLLLVFAVVWLSSAAITRYSSLAALIASLLVPVYALRAGMDTVALALFGMTVIVYLTHRSNISRLMKGTETRIGAK